MGKPSPVKLIDNRLGTGAGEIQQPNPSLKSFQAVGQTTAGSGSATIQIQVSNDGINWILSGTITLSFSTTAATDGYLAYMSWPYVRANVTAISGTGARVTVTMAG